MQGDFTRPGNHNEFVFGVYPGGEAGSDAGVLFGPPDDPAKIEAALARLQGSARKFVVRAYELFADPGSPWNGAPQMPDNYTQYLRNGRQLDLVIKYQSRSADIRGYVDFVRTLVREHGRHLYSVQVTEEANFTNGPACIDGAYPKVREALVQGVMAAKEEARRLQLDVKAGFNSTPTFGDAEEFWPALLQIGGPSFVESVDYIGLDAFPDVFHPVAKDGESGDLKSAIVELLEIMRTRWLPASGIAAGTPIHIAEHGWPTGPSRSESRQAEVIEHVIRTVYEVRERLNVERYTLFGLRDTDDSQENADNIFRHFGIMTAVYEPKPAFEAFRRLVAELTVT